MISPLLQRPYHSLPIRDTFNIKLVAPFCPQFTNLWICTRALLLLLMLCLKLSYPMMSLQLLNPYCFMDWDILANIHFTTRDISHNISNCTTQLSLTKYASLILTNNDTMMKAKNQLPLMILLGLRWLSFYQVLISC